MSNQLVFLFSPANEECIDTWKILKEKHILNTLIKINVEDPQNKIPKTITTLPTLLIRGERMIHGKESIIKYFNISNTSSDISSYEPVHANDTKRKTLPPLKDVPFSQQNDSMFLNTNELGNNWSDNYSFVDSDITQKHSFEFIEKDSSDTQNPHENINNKNKKNALELRMEEMMNVRNEIKPFKRV